MIITDKHIECLQCLSDEWNAPMDLGGYDGSHHSGTLRQLAVWGLAERKSKYSDTPQLPEEIKRPKGWGRGRRGSPKVYRITDAGKQALSQHKEKKDGTM